MPRNKKAKGGNMDQMEKLFAEGGMMDNSGEQVNGVEVPPGSLREEVADDIPAQLSEGEFVVPADVVRFIGLEKLMAMRDKAKQGLERMEEMGQMGNAEEVENPDQSFMQDDEDFSAEIDDIMAEEGDPTGFRIGGYVTGQDISKVPSNPAVDVGYYKHADGRMLWITKINGKPMSPPPDGFNEVSAEEFQSVGKKAEETKEAAAKSAGASTSNSGGEASPGGGSGSTGFGTGPVGLGATGLGLMALGETLGKSPSLLGQAAGAVARGVGGKMADVAIDQTTDGFNAMQAASDMPGMGSRVDAQGRVTTFSSPETIAASDAAMFGTPAPGTGPNAFTPGGGFSTGPGTTSGATSGPNAFSPGGGFSTGPGTSTGSGVTVSPVSGEVNSGTSFSPATSSGSFAGGPNAFSPGGGFSTGPGTASASTSASGGGSRSISGGGESASNAPGATDAAHGTDTDADSVNPDAADPGGGGGGGGGGKIICTAMNQAYGFGSFRNAIWIEYADKHLTKAHEVGYHTLFLPLVDYGFKQGDGKMNMVVRKVLEWGTRHRSMDLRAEMRGKKRDTTGRILRSLFEPLCYIVGKIKGY